MTEDDIIQMQSFVGSGWRFHSVEHADVRLEIIIFFHEMFQDIDFVSCIVRRDNSGRVK